MGYDLNSCATIHFSSIFREMNCLKRQSESQQTIRRSDSETSESSESSSSDSNSSSSSSDSESESEEETKKRSTAEVVKSKEEPTRKRSRSGDDVPKTSLPDRQKSVLYENVLTDCENWLLTLTFRAGKDVEKSRSSCVTDTSTRRVLPPKPNPISSKRRHSSYEREPNPKSCVKSALRRSSPKDNRPRYTVLLPILFGLLFLTILPI